MAKKLYVGDADNTPREVIKAYIGVDGIARKVAKIYVGDENGLARLCYGDGFIESIDHIEFGLTDDNIYAYSGTHPNYNETLTGKGRAAISGIGTVKLTNNAMSVTCNSQNRAIRAYAVCKVVLVDGTTVNITEATQRTGTPFIVNITASFDNQYATCVATLFGANLMTSGGTPDETKTSDVSSNTTRDGLDLTSINVYGTSYTGTMSATINSCTIATDDGVMTIPVTVVDYTT